MSGRNVGWAVECGGVLSRGSLLQQKPQAVKVLSLRKESHKGESYLARGLR